MATIVQEIPTAIPTEPKAVPAEQVVVLHGVGRVGFEVVKALVGDRRSPRLTFFARPGDVELMTTSEEHEDYAELIGYLILAVTEELDLPCRAKGTTTWTTGAGDFQPDKWFYLQGATGSLGRRMVPGETPPPDLAIEVEVSRSAAAKLELYASAGVPEVWRFDGSRLRVERLGPDGAYAESAASVVLPFLKPEEVVHWVTRGITTLHAPWGRELRAWIRAELALRRAGGGA